MADTTETPNATGTSVTSDMNASDPTGMFQTTLSKEIALNKELAKTQSANAHLSIAASLDNKATIMSIIGAILTIAVALGFHVNATVILSAAGLIVTGIFAIVHAAHTHTLMALQLLKGE